MKGAAPREHFKFALCDSQGRNEGGRGHNSPGAESLWGRQMTAGGAEKPQQCHIYIFQYSKCASERSQVWSWGTKPVSCAGRHLISLHPWW